MCVRASGARLSPPPPAQARHLFPVPDATASEGRALGWAYPLTADERDAILQALEREETELWERATLRPSTSRSLPQVYQGYHASTVCRRGVQAYWHLRRGFCVRPLHSLTGGGVRKALEGVPTEQWKDYTVRRSHPVLQRPAVGGGADVLAGETGGLRWLWDAVTTLGSSLGLRESQPGARFPTRFSDSLAILRQPPASSWRRHAVRPHVDEGNGSLEGPCPAFVVSLFEGGEPERDERCGLFVERADGSRIYVNTSSIFVFDAHEKKHGSVPSRTVGRWSVGLYQNRETQTSSHLSRECPLQPCMSSFRADGVRERLQEEVRRLAGVSK